MASLLAWHWVLIALGIALVASSITGIFWWYHRRRRHGGLEEAARETKQTAAAVVEESSDLGSSSDDPPGPTPTSTTTSDDNSVTVVDIEKIDHQLVLMPLSPRRQQKDKKIAVVADGGSSGRGNDNKYRALVQQYMDDESTRRRISLSPFLAGVESPQPPPAPASRPNTNSSCSTVQSMLPKPVISSRLNETWRGPTPPWTMPID